MEKMVRAMKSLHNMQGQYHLSVTGTAKNGAVSNKSSSHRRSKRNVAGLALVYLGVDTEFFEAKAMRHVCALYHQDNRFTLFQRDLTGRELKSFGGYLNAARSALGESCENEQLRYNQYYG
jgi:hypothetical protein